LVDVGHTLYELAGDRFEPKNSVFQSVSLTSLLKEPYSSWPRDRSILIESAWPLWRGLGDIRYAIRKSQFLVLFDKDPKIFNSLNDRFEGASLNKKDKLWLSLMDEIKPEIALLGNPAWNGIERYQVEKVRAAQSLFRKEGNFQGFEAELDRLLKE